MSPEPDLPDDLALDDGRLDEAQRTGVTDMDPETFRAAAHEVVDLMADYLAGIEARPVFPTIEPGDLRPLFPASAPEEPEALGAILADYRRLVEPNTTAWQHPGFLAYFGTTASGPGILGEMLTATIGQNPMLWRTSPIGTELEEVVVGWLREALGLPPAFDGLLTDTASTSSLIALAAAREAAGLDVAALGLGGRGDLGRVRVYASAEAHSSIEKACMTLGIGRAGLTRIPDRRGVPDASGGTGGGDRRRPCRGTVPIAVVATIGTTSSTSVDPVAGIASITERERLWLHVDAAYAGPVALIPERRGTVRGMGAGGLDRGQPAQMAVHPDGCLAAPQPSDGRAASRVQPGAGVPPDARSIDACPRLHRVPAPARAAVPGAQAVDAHPLVRSGRVCADGSSGTSSWPRRSPDGSTPTRTGSAWPRCRSPRSASAGGRPGSPVTTKSRG